MRNWIEITYKHQVCTTLKAPYAKTYVRILVRWCCPGSIGPKDQFNDTGRKFNLEDMLEITVFGPTKPNGNFSNSELKFVF